MSSFFIAMVAVGVLIAIAIAIILAGEPSPAPVPTPAPTPVPPRTVVPPTPVISGFPPVPVGSWAECELEVSKALTQLERWAAPLGRTLWVDNDHRANWLHDLTTMRQRGDIEYVKLELLDVVNTVLHAFELKFGQRVSPERIIDAARGVEIPILPPSERARIASHRMIINSSERRASFQSLLRLNWSRAETFRAAAQREFTSHHASKITGGRLSGEVRVAQSAMQTLVITRAGERGFAFAKSLDEPTLHSVFLHTVEAAPGTIFVPGMRVRALVIQTPEGPQGRSIQLAT